MTCLLQSGRGSYLGFVRHKDVLQCAQGAMARLLFYRFTLPNEKFPMPGTDAWYVLWLLCIWLPSDVMLS